MDTARLVPCGGGNKLKASPNVPQHPERGVNTGPAAEAASLEPYFGAVWPSEAFPVGEVGLVCGEVGEPFWPPELEPDDMPVVPSRIRSFCIALPAALAPPAAPPWPWLDWANAAPLSIAAIAVARIIVFFIRSSMVLSKEPGPVRAIRSCGAGASGCDQFSLTSRMRAQIVFAVATKAPRGLMEHDFKTDIDAVAAITAVPTILAVVSEVTGLGFSAIARVTGDRWICLAANDRIGLGLAPGGELNVETTICHDVHQARDAIVIDHVEQDEGYAHHHTPALYGFQSYISVPIFLADGSFFGTLCALDPRPAKLKVPGITGMFRLFADLIGTHLDAVRRVATAEASLLDARAAAELQEQFMAVLGHDMRNPLAAIAAGTRLLARTPLDERARSLIAMMEQSTARMAALIEDVIDLARSRLGGQIPLVRSLEPLEPALVHVIDEMRATHPRHRINAEFAITKPVYADRQRMARLLSNLLGNALNYGDPETPVEVRVRTGDGFTLSVTNHGPAIPPAMLDKLFAPFVRGQDSGNPQGLGLGLYIVSQIAAAHGGTIDVTSTDAATCFTFRMPLAESRQPRDGEGAGATI